MSITINELAVTVPGNIVKNNDKDGNTVLRVSQEQAQSLHDQLGPVLDFFAAASVNNKTGTVSVPAEVIAPAPAPKGKVEAALKEAGIQHDGDPA